MAQPEADQMEAPTTYTIADVVEAMRGDVAHLHRLLQDPQHGSFMWGIMLDRAIAEVMRSYHRATQVEPNALLNRED